MTLKDRIYNLIKMDQKQKAKHEIQILVDKFIEHKDEYRQSTYNEAQTRKDFIDPFFAALGWDIENTDSKSEAYREVVYEDKVRIEGKLKWPDYSFRLNGKRYFFVEAKKPYINIKTDSEPAYQIKRYAWSAKLKVSIVTDFEEFAVYDCTSKPSVDDIASKSRLVYIKFEDYLEKFDYLWDTFSKHSVENGNYEKYISRDGRRGTSSVDDEFLSSLDRWRVRLATDLFANNSNELDDESLNQLVQNTIDRLIFLRIAEDRNLEHYGTIKNCIVPGQSYQNLYKLFVLADQKYNSGLFNFSKDRISAKVKISDSTLVEIISEMYFPLSPFEFSVIPVEILGSAYEQFLGKTIRVTENNEIEIEEKPDVRKAGGVYYTPYPIVNYIVVNTVGKLIEGKTPAEIKAIKIVDPASGSGSFLLGAYEYLLNYHLNYYLKNSKSRGKKNDPLNPDGTLTTEVKKQILLNNIYGVDLDSNAVEVTKLSLLLKCLEGESQASLQAQQSFFHQRVLPTLDQNIKCGNSLIDTDFFEIESNLSVIKKVKPFNWGHEFKSVCELGGFDAIIGNPPWGATIESNLHSYLMNRIPSTSNRNFETYSMFTECLLKTLKPEGLLGFIIPDTFMRKDDFVNFRSILLGNITLIEIVETGPVFSKVRDTWCTILTLKNQLPDIETDILHKQISRFVVSVEERLETFEKKAWSSQSIFKQIHWMQKNMHVIGYLQTDRAQLVIDRIERFPRLGTIGEFKISRGEEGSKLNISEIESGDFRMIIPADVDSFKVELGVPIDSSTLTPNKISYIYTHPKLWIIRIQKMRWPKRLVAALDSRTNTAGMKTLQSITSLSDDLNSLYFLQAILSSKLINFWCLNYLADDLNQGYLSKIPIAGFSPPDAHKNEAWSKIVNYVIQLITIKADRNPNSAQIHYIETQIDNQVYNLYGLSAMEISLVEETQNGI